jgi:DNA-binding NtrC family response regulator
MQSKILRAIERKQVVRLGSNKNVPIDIRLIYATNVDILEMVSRQRFRQYLLYRINTVEIHLPPLRERGEDLKLLPEHFLKIFCKKYNKPEKGIGASTMNELEAYTWPGNVRELQHCMERAIILSESDTLQPEDFLLTASGAEGDAILFDNYNLDLVEKIVIQKDIEKILIPFYTTKKQWSGIGLSLPRQILRLHHATISVDSKPVVGTTFTIKFS